MEGLASLAAQYGSKAVARTLIGYADEAGNVEFFEGELAGTIVPPQKGASVFGWNDIFIPEGETRTFSHMSPAEKNAISMRAKAAQKLRDYLEAR